MNDQTQTNDFSQQALALLFTPSDAVVGIHERRQAQLSAGFVLTLILISLLHYLVIVGSADTLPLAKVGGPILIAVLILGYGLSRTKYFDLGAFIGMLGLLASVYFFLVVTNTASQNGTEILATATLIVTLMASMLLSTWLLIFFMAANLGGIFYLPSIHPSYSVLHAQSDASLIFFVSLALLIAVVYRNVTEKRRLHDLEQTNRELQAIHSNREEHANEKIAELNKHATQLEAAALVVRAAVEVRDLKELLNTVVQQIGQLFEYYHAGIFLVDVSRENIILQAASSSGGKQMIERGYRQEIGRHGIVGYAAFQKSPRIAQDVGVDAVFFNNPDLPDTHSEVALPLTVQGRLIGVLDIQSRARNAFSTNDVYTLQTMADQVALAIENARLIEESRSALESLEALNAQNTANAWKRRVGKSSWGYTYTPLGTTPAEHPIETQSSAGYAIAIPIILRGKRIGTITLKRAHAEADWTTTEEELAEKVATQVALAVENARLLEESQRRASKEQIVNEISGRFSHSLDVNTLLQNAVRELQRLPEVSDVAVFVSPTEDSTAPKPKERHP